MRCLQGIPKRQMSEDEILYKLRTWLYFHDPIFVVLRAFFHPGKSMVHQVTERAPCHAGIPPTVYLKTRARRACVDYDAKTAGIEPCIGCCWRGHGWVDGRWQTLRLGMVDTKNQVRYVILTDCPFCQNLKSQLLTAMVQKTRVDGTSIQWSLHVSFSLTTFRSLSGRAAPPSHFWNSSGADQGS